MIEAMLLAAALIWLAIAIGAGAALYRWRRKRWMQVAGTLFLIWLPFWDVIPGYYLYQKAVREVGGVRIYRTVEAEGYLDLTQTDCASCWRRLRDSAFNYLEIAVTRVSPNPSLTVTPVPGFYEFRLVDRDSAQCQEFESMPNAEKLRQSYGFGDRCVAVVRRSAPHSRYQYETSTGWVKLWDFPLLRPVEISQQRIVDRVTGELLAESREVRFVSWLSGQLEMPGWQLTRLPTGGRITFEVSDVLIPA